MRVLSLPLLIFGGLVFLTFDADCQAKAFEKPRITVAEGLPQSYVSGVVQDGRGFLWIATLDGLARYEGHTFKLFRHIPGDTASLAANIILNVFLDNSQRLWIQYEGGKIDILDTETEHLFHLTKKPAFKALFSNVKTYGAIAEDNNQNYWLLGDRGGIFIADLAHNLLHFYSDRQLGFEHNRITGLAIHNNNIMLVTDTALVIMDRNSRIKKVAPYRFASSHLFNSRRNWKNNSPVIRKDGSLVIIDEDRLIIYNPVTNSFSVKPLPGMRLYVSPKYAIDVGGNVIFSYFGTLYKLSPADELAVWDSAHNKEAISAMLLDFSGVLWVGTTGYGLRQFDTRVPRMPAFSYCSNFAEDILHAYLHLSEKDIKNSPLDSIRPYLWRWTKDKQDRIWMCEAGADRIDAPNLCLYQNGKLFSGQWRYTDTVKAMHNRVNALAFSQAGRLWGIDYNYRLLQFDTSGHTVAVLNQLKLPDVTKVHEISSMLIDGENIFWISCSAGLIQYNLVTKKSILVSDSIAPGYFTVLVNDPSDKNVLWAGTVGNGLIKLNKKNYRFTVYTTRDGLPNNTVYAIVAAQGKLWCSSNKGVFLFDPRTATVRSYTTLDGLPADEFNRMHFFQVPDGDIAFGGTNGYTVFNPAVIARDTFNPSVVITGFKINNKEADYGTAGSPLTQSVNSIKRLVLSHRQNFLSFDFAATEYNIPEKLKYRYMMEGLDKQWVEAGINNTAAYTSLPHGRYVFKVNATNTMGEWSTNIKAIEIDINPPFWLTWWFVTLCLLTGVLLLYAFIRGRIAAAAQKSRLNNEVIILEAQALRAQMNPHFIFNCLNSIKALIQEDKKQQAVVYLTTFSKLIRWQLNNTQQEITLYDELQTCRLYTQMESLRFGDKVTCHFAVGDTADTQTVIVPPLFLQPVIENAIWHGILPMQTNGFVNIIIERKDGFLYCIVDDNGIGRLQSENIKSKTNVIHQSRGMQLVNDRLRLYNMKSEGQATVEVIDKYDELQKAAGTQVIFKFKVND